MLVAADSKEAHHGDSSYSSPVRVYGAKYAKGEMDEEEKWSGQRGISTATDHGLLSTPQMSSPSISSCGMASPSRKDSRRSRTSIEGLNRLLRQEGFRGVGDDRHDDPEELVEILKQVEWLAIMDC